MGEQENIVQSIGSKVGADNQGIKEQQLSYWMPTERQERVTGNTIIKKNLSDGRKQAGLVGSDYV